MQKSFFFPAMLFIGLLIIGCRTRTGTAPAPGPTLVKVPTEADFAGNPPLTQEMVKHTQLDLTYADIKRSLGSEGIQLPGKYTHVFWDSPNVSYYALFKDDRVILFNNDEMHLKVGDTFEHAKQALGEPSSVEERTPVVWGGNNNAYLVVEFRDGRKRSSIFYKKLPLKNLLDTWN